MDTLTSTHPFEIIAPFEVKSMEDGSLELNGYASTFNNRDKQGDTVVYGAFDRSIEKFMQNPKMLFEHDWNYPIGTFPEATIDDKGLFVKGMVSNSPEYADIREGIKSGIYRSFSIGGYFTRKQTGDQKFIVDVDLREISVVRNPANDFASFTVQGALAKSMDYVQAPEMEYGAPSVFEHKSLEPEQTFIDLPPVIVNLEGDGLDEFLHYHYGVPVAHNGRHRLEIKSNDPAEIRYRLKELDSLAWRTGVHATVHLTDLVKKLIEED